MELINYAPALDSMGQQTRKELNTLTMLYANATDSFYRYFDSEQLATFSQPLVDRELLRIKKNGIISPHLSYHISQEGNEYIKTESTKINRINEMFESGKELDAVCLEAEETPETIISKKAILNDFIFFYDFFEDPEVSKPLTRKFVAMYRDKMKAYVHELNQNREQILNEFGSADNYLQTMLFYEAIFDSVENRPDFLNISSKSNVERALSSMEILILEEERVIETGSPWTSGGVL